MEDKKDFLFRFISIEKRRQLKLDDEAFYSVTDQYTADRISKDILRVIPDLQIITDATACIGGNTYSFSKYFHKVNAIEVDFLRYQYLQHNIKVLETSNVDIYLSDLLIACHRLYQDLIFIDPPWGGPEYKSKEVVDLFISEVELSEVCEHIKDTSKYIALKVPTNFNEKQFVEKTHSFMKLIYKNTELRKMHLLIFQLLDEHSPYNSVSLS
uniref:Trimethylguanosine synthase n=1 Tax=viral metagenome TaxID=1070528 RepID=A0A6C0CTX7_9ZZZZ